MEFLSTVLIKNATHNKHSKAFFLLDKHGEIIESISNERLLRNAVSLSKRLSEYLDPGDRALLVYPTGIKFIETFFACVLSGVIPVPICPPRSKLASWEKVYNIVLDCEASAIIFDSKQNEYLEWRNEFCVENSRCISLDYEDLDVYSISVEDAKLSEQEVAFIQYSSGSTSFPKGVVVTHKNIIENQITIKREFSHGKDTKVLSWLPHYHDMGLVGSILQSLYIGAPCYLISSSVFINRPLLWLECISKYRITTSGAPNFGYQLCLDRLTSQQSCTEFDLSSWRVAFSGSEPVKNKTIIDFACAFEKYGFRLDSFYPCYGLAEATLFVSGRHYDTHSVSRFRRIDYDLGRLVQLDDTQSNEASVSLVSCGRKNDSFRIVKPDMKSNYVDCEEGEIGEICVSGANISKGYFGRLGDDKSGFYLGQEGKM